MRNGMKPTGGCLEERSRGLQGGDGRVAAAAAAAAVSSPASRGRVEAKDVARPGLTCDNTPSQAEQYDVENLMMSWTCRLEYQPLGKFRQIYSHRSTQDSIMTVRHHLVISSQPASLPHLQVLGDSPSSIRFSHASSPGPRQAAARPKQESKVTTSSPIQSILWLSFHFKLAATLFILGLGGCDRGKKKLEEGSRRCLDKQDDTARGVANRRTEDGRDRDSGGVLGDARRCRSVSCFWRCSRYTTGV
ncbi:hypothetical protein V8C26DRAFT_407011 [Trichoderma gracile]